MQNQSKNREEGIFYDEETTKQWGECCENCHDVTFEKTYPAHTAYHACINLACKCHSTYQDGFKDGEKAERERVKGLVESMGMKGDLILKLLDM